MATSGDRYLATSGDFFMATDSVLRGAAVPAPGGVRGLARSLGGE